MSDFVGSIIPVPSAEEKASVPMSKGASASRSDKVSEDDGRIHSLAFYAQTSRIKV